MLVVAGNTLAWYSAPDCAEFKRDSLQAHDTVLCTLIFLLCWTSIFDLMQASSSSVIARITVHHLLYLADSKPSPALAIRRKYCVVRPDSSNIQRHVRGQHKHPHGAKTRLARSVCESRAIHPSGAHPPSHQRSSKRLC